MVQMCFSMKQNKKIHERKAKYIPHSSGFLDEQSASFPGRDEDLNTLFSLTNSLALFAARAAYLGIKVT